MQILIWKGARWGGLNVFLLFLKLFSLRGKQTYMLYRKHVIWEKIITATLFSCGTHCLDSSKVQKRITTHTHDPSISLAHTTQHLWQIILRGVWSMFHLGNVGRRYHYLIPYLLWALTKDKDQSLMNILYTFLHISWAPLVTSYQINVLISIKTLKDLWI